MIDAYLQLNLFITVVLYISFYFDGIFAFRNIHNLIYGMLILLLFGLPILIIAIIIRFIEIITHKEIL